MITSVIYYSNMGSDSREPEAKEASSHRKKIVRSASLLEKLVAMNAELRQYTLVIIIVVDTLQSSGGRA